MAEIKRLDAIREKWTRVTPGRTEDYKPFKSQPGYNITHSLMRSKLIGYQVRCFGRSSMAKSRTS